jgi:hypothetical protein
VRAPRAEDPTAPVPTHQHFLQQLALVLDYRLHLALPAAAQQPPQRAAAAHSSAGRRDAHGRLAGRGSRSGAGALRQRAQQRAHCGLDCARAAAATRRGNESVERQPKAVGSARERRGAARRWR